MRQIQVMVSIILFFKQTKIEQLNNASIYSSKDYSNRVGYEGLPENKDLIVKRETTLIQLRKELDNYRTVLITAPPFSGKTCLYQLYRQKYPECIQISFASFNGTTLEELNSYFIKRELTFSENKK